MSLKDRLIHAWNALRDVDPTSNYKTRNIGVSNGYRPDRTRLRIGNEKSIVSTLYNKIAVDVSSIDIKHVRVDQNGNYLETILSGLNECLTIEANLDQTSRAFIIDAVMSMFDEGCVAIVPVETTIDPTTSTAYDVTNLRTAKILEWFPTHIRVRIYNEQSGNLEELLLPKKMVAIVENPLYSIMNEPNSTLQRLIRKLNLLDSVDEQSSSGKLDLLIQLPYMIRSEARKEQAANRKKDIEDQLINSKYGIAYIDATEKITQLNRPTENNLLNQITFLTNTIYGQLGITENVFNGTASETEMLNYFNRTIEPVLAAIVDEMKRKFLSKTARSQRQSISYFRDPFKLVPVTALAEAADKFTRNEIFSSNEFRAIIGYKPSDNPKADELRNKNIPESKMIDVKSNKEEGI